MSTLRTDTLSNAAGSKSVPVNTVVDGSAKAWGNFNGYGTVAIRVAFNVTSITDNATGVYTVNFTNAMPDANYTTNVTTKSTTTAGVVPESPNASPTASGFSLTTFRPNTLASADAEFVSVTVFR